MEARIGLNEVDSRIYSLKRNERWASRVAWGGIGTTALNLGVALVTQQHMPELLVLSLVSANIFTAATSRIDYLNNERWFFLRIRGQLLASDRLRT